MGMLLDMFGGSAPKEPVILPTHAEVTRHRAPKIILNNCIS